METTTNHFIPERWTEAVVLLAARNRGQQAFRLKTTARYGTLHEREQYAVGRADLLAKIEDAVDGAEALSIHVTPIG